MRRKCTAVVLAIVMLAAMLGFAVPASAEECSTCTSCGDWQEYTLFADQGTPLGVVKVNNCEDKVAVQYVLSPDAILEGWEITEIHLALGDTLAEIPQTKKFNPVPGQFEKTEVFDPAVTFSPIYCFDMEEDWNAPGEDLVIAAHAVVAREDCVVNAVAPYGPSEVMNIDQGLRYNYTAVNLDRSNPETVLTYDVAQSAASFFSLGFAEDRAEYLPSTDGSLVVRFDTPVVNGSGPDIQIIEDTWGGQGTYFPVEQCLVYASEDGVAWTLLGTATNTTPYDAIHSLSELDLGTLTSASYVKVQDSTLRSDFAAYVGTHGFATVDGFDVNVIRSIQTNRTCTTYSETGWGEGTGFPGSNWAMYMTYTIQDCAPVCTQYCVNFRSVADGVSVEGAAAVQQYLNIQNAGGPVSAPLDLWSNGMNIDPTNGGFYDPVGFADVRAYDYTFNIIGGVSACDFTLHMSDFGDYNPTRSSTHVVTMTAYDANNNVVGTPQVLSYTSDGAVNPLTSTPYGRLYTDAGNATTALPGEPGNWTWHVSGEGIVKVVLDFGVGYDPNISFDKLCFTASPL